MQIEFQKVWSQVDCLITTAVPIPAPRTGQQSITINGEKEDTRRIVTRFARGMNLLGLPAISIPCAVSSSGVPMGLQIAGPAFEESLVLRVAAALEDGGVGIPPCPTS